MSIYPSTTKKNIYTIDDTISCANSALCSGNTDAAISILSDLPPSPQKNLMLANIYEAKGDYIKAKQIYYDTAVRYTSNSSRAALNKLCLSLGDNAKNHKSCPIYDYNGNKISFKKKNIPVEGCIYYENGRAILFLHLNVVQRHLSDMKLEKPSRVIIQGIKQWQGSYTVFGGYDIEVRIKCTSSLKRHNSLIINILDDELTDSVTNILSKLGKKGKRSAQILSARRQSAASFGRTWRLNSIKYINLYKKDLLNIPHCKYIIRHEFGHILGLDDMYSEKSDGRNGVSPGNPHLAPFHIRNNIYNMIMCSVDAPVNYKDIEMLLLAYQNNEIQRYQQRFGKGEISSALTYNDIS